MAASERESRTGLGRGVFILLWLAGLLVSGLGGFIAPAHANSLQAKLDQAREYYDKAREVHASLVLTPPEQRTEKEYASLIEDFRRVYLTAPTYGNDTVCLMMVGDLSVDAARRFNEPRYFQTAIDSYEFLLKEYPQSQFRFDATLSIARIYREDLAQPAKALEQYKRYLKSYPGSAQSRQVEVEIARLQDDLGDSSSKPAEKPAEMTAEKTGGRLTAQASMHSSAQTSAPPAAQASAPVSVSVAPQGSTPQPSDAGNPASKPDKKIVTAAGVPANGSEPVSAVSTVTPAPAAGPSVIATPATISDVRFWKTADYSRVVLETGQKVKYEVGRATSPDRLYLDLYDTKVAPAAGKTVAVNDELLKSIRLGQYKAGVSRVVLDLADKTEFAVSELTNPYRLVIDIHPAAQAGTPATGTDVAKQSGPGAQARGMAANTAANQAPAAPFAAKQSSPASSTVPDAKAVAAAKTPDKTAAADRTSTKVVAVAAKPETMLIAKSTLPATPLPPSTDKLPSDKPTADRPTTDKPSAEKAPADRTSVDRSLDRSVDKIKAADPISGSGQTLTRALGLKIGRILIDPGHGGHDTGTIGPSGYTEKELVLDVSERLGKLIEDRLGSEVSYTREDDNFVPLEERAEMANKMQADLFISIHANSSRARSASGIETYYLSLTADPEALEVAARENAVSQETISELQGLVQKIALNEKVDESKEFATKVQAALNKNLSKGKTNRFDRGVKKAPFVVLIGANMPAILAEISFLSNPEEEKKLKTPEQRQKIAEALYAGVSGYAGTLSGVKNVHDVKQHDVKPDDKSLETSQPAQGQPKPGQPALPSAPAHTDKSQPTQTASLQ